MKKLAALLLLLALTARANDCIPLTFTTLSKMSGEARTYADWKTKTMPDGQSPQIVDAVKAWNSTQRYTRLVCIYSIVPDVPFKDEGIELNTPYLWIGIPPSEMVEPDEKNPGAHAAVLIFREDRISIVHTVDAKTKVEERVSAEQLVKRTFCIFKVDQLVEFVHFETTGEVLIIDRRE